MANQIITTSYEPDEFQKLIADCVSRTVKIEVASILSIPKSAKEILTRQETAELLDISLPTLHDYTKKGFIIAFKLGNKVRYKISDINDSLTKRDFLNLKR